MNSREQQLKAFGRLLDIMDELRLKCPWDKKQTFQSLRHLTIEETYELGDAILNNDLQEIKKELGDVLLHIVFYAKIGSETDAFDITDVANSISEKLIHRHPHVFGDVKVESEEEDGHLWHICYPFVNGPQLVDGQTAKGLVVATTRPETMLGDVAVMVNPEDARYAVRLLDMVGQSAMIFDVNAVAGPNMQEIDLRGMAKGVYLLNVQSEKGELQTLRLVIE